MENISDSRKIEIGQETLNVLNTTRRWTMFLAILGFITIGIILIIGIFAGLFLSVFNSDSTLSGFEGALVIILILVMTVIYFFPVFFLFRFSKHTSTAVKTLDKHELHKAFKNLKAFYVYTGILVIILMSVYLVAFIAMGASFAFLKDLGTGI